MGINNAIEDLISLKVHKRRRVWEPFMRKYGCDVIAEVGVDEGRNFRLMIAHNPKIAVAVDAWVNDGVVARNVPKRDGALSQEKLEEQYEGFKKSIEDKPFVKIVREYTTEAVKKFEDNYFDLIYIDADHTYLAALQDIRDWFPKVKSGKFLIGDDYREADFRGVKFGVIQAVNEFAKENNLIIHELPLYGWAIIKP